MRIEEHERQCLLGALDSLAVALADYDHEWTVGERTIYEEAIKILTASSPSHIERANLTVRLHCKRLARLTLAFSKKFENFQAGDCVAPCLLQSCENAQYVALYSGNGRWR